MKMPLVIALLSISAAVAGEGRQPQPSSAPSFVPAPGQRFSLDLDTAPGASSNWQHHDLGSLSALRATIRVPRIGRDAKWAPSFSVWLEKADAKQALDRVGIQFVSFGQKLPLITRMVQFQAGKLAQTENSEKTLNLSEKVTVEIMWATPHVVTINIGDSESHTLNIPWSIDSVEVSASTGEMQVDPLVLGTVGQ
jgi:hypothetical protein